MERDRGLGVTKMGVRHVMADGRWMQPEPLLWLGLPDGGELSPRAWMSTYAVGNPVVFGDRSGYGAGEIIDSATTGCEGSQGCQEAADELIDVSTTTTPYLVTGYAIGGTVVVAGPTAGAMVAGEEALSAATGLPVFNPKQALLALAKTPWKLAEGFSAVRTFLRGGACFVAGTQVVIPAGELSIEDVEVGDLVFAAVQDGVEEAWVEVLPAPTENRAVWAPRRFCDRVKRWAKAAVVPAVMLVACDVAKVPAASEVVQVYESSTGTWFEDEVRDVDVGSELLYDGHLFRAGDTGMVDLGSVGVSELADADAVVTEVDAVSEPTGSSWVLVLAGGDSEIGHAMLSDLVPGNRFAFQGRVHETFGDERVEHVRETGELLGRVVRTIQTEAPGVYDLDIQHADGSVETITGTEEHPFWVPDVSDWVAMADLEVGTLLRTFGGGEATVTALSFKPGPIDVFNIEVEGVHNYFVRGPDGVLPGVLVHNANCFGDALRNLVVPWGQTGHGCGGCEDVAEAIQDTIGGSRHTISPSMGIQLGPRAGEPTGWATHDVVVKDGRVYDTLTGPNGMSVGEYKALWEYEDAIDFGF